jgi:uncharacterized protein DUF2793
MGVNSVLGPLVGLWRRFKAHDTYVEEQDRNLDRIEALLATPRVLDKDLSTPPGSPSDGDIYIAKATALGAWAGEDKYLQAWFDETIDAPSGEWVGIAPREGMLVWVVDEACLYVYTSSAWTKLTASSGGGVGGGSGGFNYILLPLNPVGDGAWAARSGGAGGQYYGGIGGFGGNQDKVVAGSFVVPGDWASLNSAKLVYTQNGTSNAPWVFKWGLLIHAQGTDASAVPTYATQNTITPPTTTDQIDIVALNLPTITLAPGDLVKVQMERRGNDAGDTNANQMVPVGLILKYARP